MKYYFMCLFIIFFSCEKIDYSSLAESYRKPEYLLIVKKLNDSLSVYNFDIQGVNLKTGMILYLSKKIVGFVCITRIFR